MNSSDNKIQKVSIRFFNDREVRAVWDEMLSKWWFSVLDVVGVLNDQDDYTKNRNYWKYLKTKLKKEGNEVVSVTNQLKLLAPDGKRRLTDVLDTEGILQLAACFPNTKASRFVAWLTNSEESIDGKSPYLTLLSPSSKPLPPTSPLSTAKSPSSPSAWRSRSRSSLRVLTKCSYKII